MPLVKTHKGQFVNWEPTTALICSKCREPLEVSPAGLEQVNFTFDYAVPDPLELGKYWYLHKHCSSIEQALDVHWGMHDMPYVLGINGLEQKLYGSLQKYLKTRMPPGAYQHLYEQWRPALLKKKVSRVLLKPETRPCSVITLKPPRPERAGRPGHVYLIEAVGTNRIKIGHGRSAQQRLQQLATGTPFPLRLLHIIQAQDSYALEQALQTRYAAYRMHNEWFALPADVLTALLQEDFTL